jgi:hypothetical protein
VKAFGRPGQQRPYDMIIDVDKVKVAWPGRGRLVENFADCWAGGGDCRASDQDKAGYDERELHRVRAGCRTRKLFYFLEGRNQAPSHKTQSLDATHGYGTPAATPTSDLSAKGSEPEMLVTRAGGVRGERVSPDTVIVICHGIGL